MSDLVLCVDVGSTFTKSALVDVGDGRLHGTDETPTTPAEVLDGVRTLYERSGSPARLTLCSSAGGGLRLAVVGYEERVTAEAGRRVALSAGGRVVAITAGPLDAPGIDRLRAAAPDLIVLVGGTDGGNADVLRHNARRLGIARLAAPVVLAGNADAAGDAARELTDRGRQVTVTANVLPRIGELDPLPARAAIRQAFLEHVIGGKGLSGRGAEIAGRTFAQLVEAPTPDAVLTGVGVLAAARNEDVLVVDVGGATTDVYSVLTRLPGGDVVGAAQQTRTVEGDLGTHWSAAGVAEAAAAEGLPVPDGDEDLAAVAVRVAVRRHGRPDRPGAVPRPLRDVSLVVGSGGVLRHSGDEARRRILGPLLADHAGGWAVPDRAALAVDDRYVLFAAGLLAPEHPEAAAALVTTLRHR
jgi:uncharacterized protein (TIGR01319 family)